MATNPFFNNFNNANEQSLYDDLVVESIRIYGHDLYYLPRTGIKEEEMMNEFSFAEFNKAIAVEMYVKNFDSFEGEGQFLSKFGLEIRDQMRLVLSIRSFKQFIQPFTNNPRPYEGDCIYVPMTGVMYQIKYVDTSAIFYSLGKLYTYEITCEVLEYSNEKFNTGVPEIDNKYPQYQDPRDPNYNIASFDNNADNNIIEEEADEVLDFSELNPFGSEED